MRSIDFPLLSPTDTFSRGAFTAASLPEADITAFVRNTSSSSARCINVMWTGQDQVCLYTTE